MGTGKWVCFFGSSGKALDRVSLTIDSALTTGLPGEAWRPGSALTPNTLTGATVPRGLPWSRSLRTARQHALLSPGGRPAYG